jgi:hypothetical protein
LKKPNREKKPIKILKKLTSSVPKPEKKKAKPEKTELNQKNQTKPEKTEPNRFELVFVLKNRTETGRFELVSVRFF